MFAARGLRAPAFRSLRSQPARQLHKTRQLRAPNPKEDHRAHTVSQRLRQIRKVPPELIPLGVVLGIALAAAAYSSIHKLFSDKTLRLKRQGKQA